MMKLGFIGLGSQGGPMAQRMIDAGYPVVLWARRRETLQPFSDTPAQLAESIAELGEQSEHVGICVVDDAGVQQVCEALIPAMRPGGRIAIHSTIHPDTVVALAKQAADRGISVIDAPVSGGGPAAAAGTLTVMIGGDQDVVAASRPVFETFAGLIVHLGSVGAGQMAKLVNNALMAAHFAIAHHALEAADALAIDRSAMIELVKVSSGRSFGFEVYSRLSKPTDFSFGAKLLAKDVKLLGNALGDAPCVAALRDLAMPVLELALRE